MKSVQRDGYIGEEGNEHAIGMIKRTKSQIGMCNICRMCSVCAIRSRID